MSECKKFKRDFDSRGLNTTTQHNLEEANSLQEQLESMNKDMTAKILSIIEEFSTRKRPLYDKRHAILRNIPHFWAIAFINHPKLKLLINNSIEDCFHYMQYVQVIETDVKSGFQIVFGFDSNPYFYNTKLIKNYVWENEEFIMKKCVIDWKENMNLCNENSKKSVPGLHRRKRAVTPLENFFDWLLRSAPNDFICDIIRDDLWVDPLKYFFMSDDANEIDSESESEDDDDCDDFLDEKRDYSDEDELNSSENDDKTA